MEMWKTLLVHTQSHSYDDYDYFMSLEHDFLRY